MGLCEEGRQGSNTPDGLHTIQEEDDSELALRFDEEGYSTRGEHLHVEQELNDSYDESGDASADSEEELNNEEEYSEEDEKEDDDDTDDDEEGEEEEMLDSDEEDESENNQLGNWELKSKPKFIGSLLIHIVELQTIVISYMTNQNLNSLAIYYNLALHFNSYIHSLRRR